jgi:hypothetical protein
MKGAPAMRGLTIGIALAAIVFLATGGHFLLIPLLIPLGFFAFLRKRAAWKPHTKATPSVASNSAGRPR